MRMAPWLCSAALIALVSSCSHAKQSGNTGSDSSAAAANAAANPSSASPAAASSPAASPAPAATAKDTTSTGPTAGLPSFCSYAASTTNTADGCFTCTPRIVPLIQCPAVASGFNPSNSCTYTSTALTCTTGVAAGTATGTGSGTTTASAPSSGTFTFTFSDQSLAEDLYDALPAVIIGAKLVVSGDLGGNQTLSTLVNGILDAINSNSTALFVSGDVTPLITQIETLVQTADPNLPATDLAIFSPIVAGAIDNLRTKIQSVDFSANDLTSFISTILAALPSSITNGATIGSTLNIGSILQNLTTSGGITAITSLLTGLSSGTGGNPIGTIITGLEGAAGANGGTSLISGLLGAVGSFLKPATATGSGSGT